MNTKTEELTRICRICDAEFPVDEKRQKHCITCKENGLTKKPKTRPQLVSGLTPSEVKVLKSFVKNRYSYSAVSADLYIAETTVKTHTNNIFQKWQINTKLQMVIRALKHGLITLEECP